MIFIFNCVIRFSFRNCNFLSCLEKLSLKTQKGLCAFPIHDNLIFQPCKAMNDLFSSKLYNFENEEEMKQNLEKIEYFKSEQLPINIVSLLEDIREQSRQLGVSYFYIRRLASVVEFSIKHLKVF